MSTIMPDGRTLFRTTILLVTLLVCLSEGKKCYICSGSFPDRECELWPDTVRHGPGKQECGNRLCTTYIRFRPMQHLLIPLGHGKPKGTAAPLRPNDFEVVTISRDCVDVVDQQRNNKCFPDASTLGATCFMSCRGELCNRGVRRPNLTDLSRSGKTLSPTGPNEYDQWKPATDRSSTYQPTWKDPTTTESFVREEHTGRPTTKAPKRKRPNKKVNPDDPEKGSRGRKDGLEGNTPGNGATSTAATVVALTASAFLSIVCSGAV